MSNPLMVQLVEELRQGLEEHLLANRSNLRFKDAWANRCVYASACVYACLRACQQVVLLPARATARTRMCVCVFVCARAEWHPRWLAA